VKDTLDNNCDNTVITFPVVNFLTFVVTEVLFSIVALRHWHFTM